MNLGSTPEFRRPFAPSSPSSLLLTLLLFASLARNCRNMTGKACVVHGPLFQLVFEDLVFLPWGSSHVELRAGGHFAVMNAQALKTVSGCVRIQPSQRLTCTVYSRIAIKTMKMNL